MNAEQGSHHEISPEFRAVSVSVARLRATKDGQSRKAKKTYKREYKFLEEMYHETDEVIARLAIVLGVSDLPESRKLLEIIVENDNEPLIRHEAAFGLGLTQDPEAIPLLVEKGLNDVNDVVRHESALALGTIGDPIALEPLMELLKNERAYGKGTGENIVAPSCEVAIFDIHHKQEKSA